MLRPCSFSKHQDFILHICIVFLHICLSSRLITNLFCGSCFVSCVLKTAFAPKVLKSLTLSLCPQTPRSPLLEAPASSFSPPHSCQSTPTFPSSIFHFPSPPPTPPFYLLPVAPVLPHFFTLPYSPPSSPQSPFSCSSFFFPPDFSSSVLHLPLSPFFSSLSPPILSLASCSSSSPTVQSPCSCTSTPVTPPTFHSSPASSSVPVFAPATPSLPTPTFICATFPLQSPPTSERCATSSPSSSPPPSPLPPGVPPYFRRDRSIPDIYI